jgi:hypothetical protein
MRHLKTIALSLTVIFALSATVAAAGASAALPEIYQCAKAKKEGKTYLGHYSGKKCEASTYHAEGGQKYELEPWNAAGKGGASKVKKFKGKSGAAFLEIVGLGPVKCSKGTDTGEFTGPKTAGNIEVTFTGCELNKIPCKNTATEGEIATKTLKGEIGYYDEENGKAVPRKVGLDLTPQTGLYEAEEVRCSTLLLRVTSSVIGEVVPPYNVFTKEVKLKFQQSAGKQAIQSFEGMPKDTLLTETWNGTSWNPGAESGQSGEAVGKGEELELKA